MDYPKYMSKLSHEDQRKLHGQKITIIGKLNGAGKVVNRYGNSYYSAALSQVRYADDPPSTLPDYIDFRRVHDPSSTLPSLNIAITKQMAKLNPNPLIGTEYKMTGTFSFKEFYNRPAGRTMTYVTRYTKLLRPTNISIVRIPEIKPIPIPLNDWEKLKSKFTTVKQRHYYLDERYDLTELITK